MSTTLPGLTCLAAVAVALAAAAPAHSSTTAIDAGDNALCAVGPDGGVTCHGLDASSVAHVKDFTQVAVGLGFACGLRAGGEVLCFGDDTHPGATPPPGSFTSIGAGWSAACALDALGDATCWGDEAGYGLFNGPAGPLHGLSVGEFHECALDAASEAACWGADVSGQATPDPGPFTAVSAGGGHTCALTPAGAADCWGLDNAGQAQDRTPPAGETFVAIEAGSMSTCALTSTGRIECWGSDADGESAPPPGTFSSVSVGRGYACGIRTDGALACWGERSPLPAHAYTVAFHAPVDAAPTVNVARAGRVIPVKVEVFDAGTEVRTGRVTIDVVPSSDCGAAATDPLESYAPVPSTSPGELRFDAAADRWATGLDTSGLAAGCHRARIAVDGEPAGHFVLQLRR